jgi:hypothetical protein
METRQIEKLDGNGSLRWDGKSIDVHYRLVVKQEFISNRTLADSGGILPGMKIIDGSVQYLMPSEQVPSATDSVRLYFDDGRCVKVIVHGTSIRGTGPILESSDCLK